MDLGMVWGMGTTTQPPLHIVRQNITSPSSIAIGTEVLRRTVNQENSSPDFLHSPLRTSVLPEPLLAERVAVDVVAVLLPEAGGIAGA
jgi:hypothetical protein